jgi:hypothetical protein
MRSQIATEAVLASLRADRSVSEKIAAKDLVLGDNRLPDIFRVRALLNLEATAEETMSPIARRPMLSSLPTAE